MGVVVAVLAAAGAFIGWRLGAPDGEGDGGGFGTPSIDPNSACGGFTDEFDRDTVDTAWEKVRDGGLVLAGGAVEITAPDGSDIYETELRAPMLLRVPTGDYTVETDVAVSPGHFYQGAGLVLFNGSQNYVRLERGYGDLGAIIFEYKNAAAHVKVRSPHKGDPNLVATDAPRVQLRLTRTASQVSAHWKPYGEAAWRDLGSVPIALPPGTKAGLSVLNRAQGAPLPAAKPLTARFEYARVSCGSA